MKILCIGEALIDMICTDKGRALSDGDNFLKKPGGAPTNVAAAIAALGGSVSLVTKVGTDPFGRHLVQVMQSFGVSTEHMLMDPNHFTTFAFVSLMENGERDFYFNRGADGQLSVDDIEAVKLDEISIIHFGSATAFLPAPLQDAYRALLKKAVEKKIFICFDPNYRQLLYQNIKPSFIQQSLHFLKYCHFMKLSDEEAMLITGKSSLNDAAGHLLSATNAVFAITLGKEGTMLGYRGKTYIVPSIKVSPVDTTGAGDAFVGAVLYQLREHRLEDILKLSAEHWQGVVLNANKAGARTCEWLGAMEAFKHLNNQIFN